MDKKVAEAMAIIAKKVMINGHERVYSLEEERLEEALETVESALGLVPNFEFHSGDVVSGGYIDKKEHEKKMLELTAFYENISRALSEELGKLSEELGK